MNSKYSEGIYSRFSSAEEREFSPLMDWLPGVPHILKWKQVFRGVGLFCATIFGFVSAVFILCLPLLNWSDFKVSLWFRLAYLFGTLLLYLYLVSENRKDIDKKFRRFELDNKARVFAPSMGFSYLFCSSCCFVLLIFSLIHFIPIYKETPFELKLDFVDNPHVEKEPEAPKDAKRLAKQNAVDSGKSVKNKEHAPGKYIENTPIGAKKGSGQRSQASSVSSPNPANLSKPSKSSQASKESQQAKPSKTQNKQDLLPMPFPRPKLSDSSSSGEVLPKFKPKTTTDYTNQQSNSSNASSSNNSSSNSPKQIAYAGSNGGVPGVKGPVLSSVNSTGGGGGTPQSGNAFPNNNPNGPGTLAAKRTDIDYGPYMRSLQRAIEEVWKPAGTDGSDLVIVNFNLKKNGQLVMDSLEAIKSTSKDAEKAALKAIIDASPRFRPLPDGAPDIIKVEFKFAKTGLTSVGGRRY